MKGFNLFLTILLFSCSRPEKPITQKTSQANAIAYLKKEFKINPELKRIDTAWINHQKKQNKSIATDSLIAENLRIVYYAPLNLNFLYYKNNYHLLKDRKPEDFFSISLIEDKNSKTFYVDDVNYELGTIGKDYCTHKWRHNRIEKEDFKQLNTEEISAYNSINSERRFGDHEIKNEQRKRGIEQYLNDKHRFSKLSEKELLTLLTAYDSFFSYRQDTLTSESGLFKFLTQKLNSIKSRSWNTEANSKEEFKRPGQLHFIQKGALP